MSPSTHLTGVSTRTKLAGAFNEKTKALVMNSPNNPTGKVFGKEELESIAALCNKWDAYCVWRRHIRADPLRRQPAHRHGLPLPRHEGTHHHHKQRVQRPSPPPAWRVGWVIAPPPVTAAVRKVHDFLTVGAPAPLQEATISALGLPPDYYEDLRARYDTGTPLHV